MDSVSFIKYFEERTGKPVTTYPMGKQFLDILFDYIQECVMNDICEVIESHETIKHQEN